mgnify:CR=1 FL=1
MTAAPESRNLSEEAHRHIRRDILNGELFPDERLQIDAISERYGIGAVPIREALNRLSSEGLVARRSHRGFCVAPLSILELEELVKTRVWLETLALRQSMANGDDAWEDQLVVGFHHLARTQRRLPTQSGPEISEQWEDRHKAFHMLLLSHCGSKWLLGFCSGLMDQAVRYRNLSMNSNPNKLRREGASAEHKAILDAVLERDIDQACTLLEQHYLITLDGLKSLVLPKAEDIPKAPRRASAD